MINQLSTMFYIYLVEMKIKHYGYGCGIFEQKNSGLDELFMVHNWTMWFNIAMWIYRAVLIIFSSTSSASLNYFDDS